MNECGSAIFIFTSDAAQESDVSVINPNVAFELGAASYLYGDKLIIFKEEQIELPTDFNSIGYISFEPNKLDSKIVDLLKELVAMGFVKIMPT